MEIHEGLLAAEAEFAERSAAAQELKKSQPASTEAAAELDAPTDKINEYKSASTHLNSLRQKESDSSVKLSDENPFLESLRHQIAEAEKQKNELEAKYPKLATLVIPLPAANPSANSSEARSQSLDRLSEYARAKALEAKIKVYAAQLVKVRAEAAAVDQASSDISKLQRKKELD